MHMRCWLGFFWSVTQADPGGVVCAECTRLHQKRALHTTFSSELPDLGFDPQQTRYWMALFSEKERGSMFVVHEEAPLPPPHTGGLHPVPINILDVVPPPPPVDVLGSWRADLQCNPDGVRDRIRSEVLAHTLPAQTLAALLALHPGGARANAAQLACMHLDARALLDAYAMDDLVAHLRLAWRDLISLGLSCSDWCSFRQSHFAELPGPMHIGWMCIFADLCRRSRHAFFLDCRLSAADLVQMGVTFKILRTLCHVNINFVDEIFDDARICIAPREWVSVLGMPQPDPETAIACVLAKR